MVLWVLVTSRQHYTHFLTWQSTAKQNDMWVLLWHVPASVALCFSLWILLQQHNGSSHNIKQHHTSCISMFPTCITTCNIVLVLLTACCAIAAVAELILLLQGMYDDISCRLRVWKRYFLSCMSFGRNADLLFIFDKQAAHACIAMSCHVHMLLWHCFALFFNAVLMYVGLTYMCAMDLHVFLRMLCDVWMYF